MATHYRTCPFCEATCGLEIETEGREVVSVRGDADDVFSRGFICPKAYGIKQLHEDPDRLTTPLVRRDGELVEVSWDEAFAEIDRRLSPILAEHGRNAVAVYNGNPNAHNLSFLTHGPAWLRVLGSQNMYSASTVDQMPKQVSAGHMFGTMLSVPIPDVDRCEHVLMLGANPLVSNGSLLTAPNMRGRLRAIRERGGKVVVVDPRRTRTAEEADEHHFIQPGTDALLLAAIACTIVEEGLESPGPLAEHVNGLDEVRTLVREFTPEAAGQRNSSGPGGSGRGVRFGRWTSRVRGLPEFFGELPVAALAEEIDTPGEGQVRALVTIAGNPLLSTPNSERLARAVEGLDFMLAIDIYVNETTRHADVILPGPEPLEKAHYDLALYQLAARNVANFSPPVFESERPAEWEIFMRLAGIVAGQGPNGDPAAFDDLVIESLIQRELGTDGSPVAGREPPELLEELAPRRGPERILDFLIRTGPYGDGFGANPEGLTLDVLEQSPHGLDLGPLEPRIPDVLRTPSGKVELAPEPLVADMDRLRAALGRERNGGMVLIGRRQLRSNNSWMHNLPALVKGRESCTLHIHPDDAERLGPADGASAVVRSAAGSVEAPVEVTDGIMPGVVSIPHGWGHDAEGVRMGVASAHAGVNRNVLADESAVEPLSGNAVLNGIPVEVSVGSDGLEHRPAAVAADHVGGV